jgi:small subunit ribosomal protein S20
LSIKVEAAVCRHAKIARFNPKVFFEILVVRCIFELRNSILQLIMAHHKSALKRIRQSRKRNQYNRQWKWQLKQAIKAVQRATSAHEAEELLRQAAKVIDRCAARGVIHRNTASNRKSALARYVNKLFATTVASAQ